MKYNKYVTARACVIPISPLIFISKKAKIINPPEKRTSVMIKVFVMALATIKNANNQLHILKKSPRSCHPKRFSIGKKSLVNKILINKNLEKKIIVKPKTKVGTIIL